MKKRSKKYNKKRKKINNKKRSKNLNINILAFLLIMITFLCLNYINTSQNNYNHVLYVNNQSKLSNEQDAVENQTKLLYNTCLNEKYSDNDLDEVINNKLLEISSLLNNYNVSVSFYNPSTNFSYNYNSDRVYYAASAIKMLDAIYIYENAANGLINLDDTLIYQKDNKFAASAMIQNYNIGDSVSIRNLVKYAIMVSDNTAHDMLINYIGKDNLQDFGQSLGAQYTLYGSDNFGSITNSDAIIYLTELNNFINSNSTLGSELQSYFVNSDQNYLKISDYNIEAAEKYGQYGELYHENGIVYSNHPYLISILTTEGNDDYESIIKTINLKIYELNELFYSERQAKCNLEYYPN